jgi:4-aminobutyrate aminotransferase/(S)-3-amino-2-methylpropionate transaminase
MENNHSNNMTAGTVEDLLSLRDRSFMSQLRHQLYPTPLILEKGYMEYVWDIEGKKYLDFFSGILVTNCGHCNPEITEAIKEQLGKLQHTSTFFLTEPLIRLTEELVNVTPQGLDRVYIVNSGSEAVDGAVLSARHFTGRQEVVSLYMAYHGRSFLSMGLCGFLGYKAAGPIVPGVIFAPNGYCYRCPVGQEYPGCNLACTESVEKAIEASSTGPIAAIIAEPIQGVGGVVVSPPGYLEKLADIARAHGGLFIVDEVQSGFGRAGSMFAIENWNVSPDLMTVGKGMANGTPIASFLAREDVGEALRTPTFSTYGGNPVACTAGLATIDYVKKNDLALRARDIGKVTMEHLQEMSTRHRLMGDVRGLGLMIGVELVKNRETKEPAGNETLEVLEEARTRGLIIGKSGPYGNVLRVAPPLTVSIEQVNEGLGILDEALSAVEAKS